MSDTPQGRSGHLFTFTANRISEAAKKEAQYHRDRLAYWEQEYDTAVRVVEETVGAKIVRHPVTDGYTVEVVVDHGDPAAYTRMQQSFRKIALHRELAAQYESDFSVYGSQTTSYQLTREDVRWFRLGDEPRDEDD